MSCGVDEASLLPQICQHAKVQCISRKHLVSFLHLDLHICEAMRCDAIDENKSAGYYALHLHLHLHDVDQFDPRNTALT